MPYIGKTPLDVYQAADWIRNQGGIVHTDKKRVKKWLIEELKLLNHDTPLVRYFISIGLYHVEDMAVCIKAVYDKQQKGEDIDLDKIVLTLKTFREQAK